MSLDYTSNDDGSMTVTDGDETLTLKANALGQVVVARKRGGDGGGDGGDPIRPTGGPRPGSSGSATEAKTPAIPSARSPLKASAFLSVPRWAFRPTCRC